MNFKQKLTYTTLGAALSIVSMFVGTLLTTSAAQLTQQFDKVICRELEIVDSNGNTKITMGMMSILPMPHDQVRPALYFHEPSSILIRDSSNSTNAFAIRINDDLSMMNLTTSDSPVGGASIFCFKGKGAQLLLFGAQQNALNDRSLDYPFVNLQAGSDGGKLFIRSGNKRPVGAFFITPENKSALLADTVVGD